MSMPRYFFEDGRTPEGEKTAQDALCQIEEHAYDREPADDGYALVVHFMGKTARYARTGNDKEDYKTTCRQNHPSFAVNEQYA